MAEGSWQLVETSLFKLSPQPTTSIRCLCAAAMARSELALTLRSRSLSAPIEIGTALEKPEKQLCGAQANDATCHSYQTMKHRLLINYILSLFWLILPQPLITVEVRTTSRRVSKKYILKSSNHKIARAHEICVHITLTVASPSPACKARARPSLMCSGHELCARKFAWRCRKSLDMQMLGTFIQIIRWTNKTGIIRPTRDTKSYF